MSQTKTDEEIRENVRERYGDVARSQASCCGGDETPSSSAGALAEKLGYAEKELQELPENANLGLSCGNPVALATLSPGEVVLDLGAGGGFDCFIAGRKVGAEGRVIGVDMTADMISLARKNLGQYRELSGFDNVEFRLGEIEHLPLADSSVDVVISNCVLNLSAEKRQVWREIARVLRPGGRVAVSDIALTKPLPEAIVHDLRMHSMCIAGAVTLEDYVAQVEAVGLGDIEVKHRPVSISQWSSASDPLVQDILKKMPEGTNLDDYTVSANVSARKKSASEAPKVAAVAAGQGTNCC